MFEVVAVEDVAAPVAVETDEHARLFARGQIHGVLPAGVRGQRCSAVTGEHLEVHQVKVYRVRGWGRLQVPDLGRSQLRTGGHELRVELFAVNTHITLPSSPTRVKRNSRVRPA